MLFRLKSFSWNIIPARSLPSVRGKSLSAALRLRYRLRSESGRNEIPIVEAYHAGIVSVLYRYNNPDFSSRDLRWCKLNAGFSASGRDPCF